MVQRMQAAAHDSLNGEAIRQRKEKGQYHGAHILERKFGLARLVLALLAGLIAASNWLPEVEAQAGFVVPASAAFGVEVQWDVLNSTDHEYTVFVGITNRQLYRAISSAPGWMLSWTWEMEEIILELDGAVTNLTSPGCFNCTVCFENDVLDALWCQDSVAVIDDSGYQGALGPASIDVGIPNSSNFTMKLAKGEDYWDSTATTIPSNLKLVLPGYTCTSPAQLTTANMLAVTPGSQQVTPAAESYSMQCNSVQIPSNFSCCVSASAYYNDTLAPCKTCTCGCPQLYVKEVGGFCNASAPASDEPAAYSILGEELYTYQQNEPSLGRCQSLCGIQVHMHLAEADLGGWNLEVAVYNAEYESIVDWNAVLVLQPGFHLNYQMGWNAEMSFDDPPNENNLLVTGIPYYNNYLLGQGYNNFTIRFNTAPVNSFAYNITNAGNATTFHPTPLLFPTSVYVQGNLCKMPDFLPTYSAGQMSSFISYVWNAMLMAMIVTFLL